MSQVGPADKHTKHVSMSYLDPADSMGEKMTQIRQSVQKLAFFAIFTIPNHTKHVLMS